MKLVLKIAAGIILAVVLLVAGCAALLGSASHDLNKKKWTVHVTAPKGRCWSGAFDERTVDGCGSRTIPLRGVVVSANAQKQGGGHWPLALTLRKDDGSVADRQVTRAAYGLASVTG